MGNIFTRKALGEIMGNEALTPEQRTEQVFGLYGRALEDGYVARGAAAQARQAALESARAEWEKGVEVPDPRQSDAYKELAGEFDAYRQMQAARSSREYEGVKPKFFETVYGMVARGDGAKPVEEQLAEIRERYEEYFVPRAADPAAVPGNELRGGWNPPAPGSFRGGTPAVVLPSGASPAPGARLTLTEAMRRANAGEQVDVSQIG